MSFLNDPTVKGIAIVGGYAAVGAVLGAGAVGAGFYIIGLSTLGPVAGGWFAANMGGAGLAAGSTMATLQSLAMTGAGLAYGAGATAAVGAAVGTGVAVHAAGVDNMQAVGEINNEGENVDIKGKEEVAEDTNNNESTN